MQTCKWCVYELIDGAGNPVHLGYGLVADPTAALHPSIHGELLDGLATGALRVRVLLGAGCPVSRRTATQIARLLTGGHNPRRFGRAVTVIDKDGTERRFPTVTAAARALGVGRIALWWSVGGLDSVGRAVSYAEP